MWTRALVNAMGNKGVKEKADGNYFYSFVLEKTKDIRPEDVLSSVTTNKIGSDDVYSLSITQINPNVKPFLKNNSNYLQNGDDNHLKIIKNG